LIFSDEIIPYLTSITEKFFKYKLDDVKNFQSVYSLRFYELLHQFQAGGRGAQEIEIDELRLLLNLEDKYATFGELKRSVIDKAISEINQHSNLAVKYGERKRGKKVVAIQFSFEIKAAINPLATDFEKKSIAISYKSDNELVEQFANSRKRFGNAVNETNVPSHIVEILKNSGRW
jgi:plasmid replication initiation protein